MIKTQLYKNSNKTLENVTQKRSQYVLEADWFRGNHPLIAPHPIIIDHMIQNINVLKKIPVSLVITLFVAL